LTAGVNFLVCSREPAPASNLLFFDREDDATPSRVVELDPVANRTYHYWHVFVPGRAVGTDFRLPSRRTFGPPASGLRFDSAQGAARPVRPGAWSFRRATAGRMHSEKGTTPRLPMKSVVVDPSAYDWEGDVLLWPAFLTNNHLRDARSRIHLPSEFRSRREDPRHLRRPDREDPVSPATRYPPRWRLLPVFQFDAQDCPPGKVNYWGYAPVSFFAPHQAYSSRQDPLGPVDEFRDMVKGAAPGGHRSHTRRGVQPHRGRRPARADRQFPRHRQSDLLTSLKRAAPGTPTTLAAGTPSTPTTRLSGG